jgi:hypothetical protein
MSVTKMPGMVACTGAVVVASESSNPEALLTLTLRTERGDQYLLPLSAPQDAGSASRHPSGIEPGEVARC